MSSWPGRARSWHRRRVADSGVGHDAGTTLMEVVVAMVLMTICGSIFTGAIVTLYRTSDAAQAVTNSAEQVNQAYQTLERTVRYSSAMSAPGQSTGASATGDWYVELRNTTDGTERCTQLRVDIASGQLQRRTWQGSNVAGTLSAWLPLASGLTNASAAAGSTTQPFVLTHPARQILTVTVVAQAGAAAGVSTSKSTSTSAFAMSAINSPINSTDLTASGVCQQAGRP